MRGGGATLGSLLAATRLYFMQALAVELTYRFALLQQAAGLAVGLAGLLFFWRTAGSGVAAQATYTPALLTAYFTIAYVQLILQDAKVSWTIATSIRMGKLSTALLRPYPFLLSVAAQAMAVALLRFVLVLPALVLAFWLMDELRPVVAPLDAGRLTAFLGAVALGLVCGILTRMVVGLSAFDLTQTWGPELVFFAFSTMAGGEAYPIDLLPPSWLAASSWTPAFYMVGFPALVFLGRVDEAEYLSYLLRGIFVALSTAGVVALMWRRGLRRFEAVGI
jgi:ABC-2 type transport system permease protein